MTPSQKLALRASEIRAELATLAGADELTDESKAKIAELRTEYADVETKFQAATVAEDDPEKRETSTETIADPEARELAELRGKVKLSGYVQAAVEQRAADGAEAEYNAAVGIAGNRFPLELLAPAEERAVTGVDTQTTPRRWLDRLFADTAAMAVGVTMQAVPAGVASFPITSAGPAAAQRGKGEAAADGAWTVDVSELRPTRNAVRVTFSIEDAARIPGLESALNRDLRMALVEGVDRAIFLGDDGATGAAADIVGLSGIAASAGGLTETTLTQANKLKGPETLAAFTGLVDGIHAGGLGDLRVVSAIGAWRLWESTVLTAGASETASVFKTLSQFLRDAGLTWTSRGELETATGNGKFGAFVGRGRGIEGAAVAAVWEAGELIRDPYTGAGKGEIALTLSYLWNFGVPRPANFSRVKFVT